MFHSVCQGVHLVLCRRRRRSTDVITVDSWMNEWKNEWGEKSESLIPLKGT